jgi:hypothetical protein
MKKTILVLFTYFLPWLNGFAQEDFDIEYLSQFLIEQVNEIRSESKIGPYTQTEILDAVAFDQAEFILKSGQLSHEQTSKKKKTLSDRILFYEGLNSQSGENIAQIGLNSKAVLEIGKPKQLVDNSEKMVMSVIVSWLLEKEGKLNLLDPNFSLCGLSLIENNKKELIVVFVAASEPFVSPVGGKVNFGNFGVEKYSKEACDAFTSEHGSTAQLFSDAINVTDNKLFFKFHSLDFMNEIISSSADGIAVELVSRDQFNCNSTNQLFPGEIVDGYMLKPFNKAKLASLNSKELEGSFEIDMGELPSFYNPINYEINGMIIKDGKKCVSIPFNRIKTENVRWLNLPFESAKPKFDSSSNSIDTSVFVFNYGQLEFQLGKITNYLKGLNVEVSKIELNAKVAPVGVSEAEIRLKVESQLAEFINEPGLLVIKKEENWDAYQSFKKGTYYELETKGMTKEQELAYLKENIEKDNELKIALENLSSFEIITYGLVRENQTLSHSNKLELLAILVKLNKIDRALVIQDELIEIAKNGRSELDLLVTGDQDQLKSTLPLINNQIIAQDLINHRQFDGNPIHIAFLELSLIDPSNSVVSYNYHASTLHYWSKSVKNIKGIEKWKKGFDKLKSSSLISQDLFNKTYLNYLIIAADYYYEKSNFEKRKKAFDEILKYGAISKLNDQEYLSLARYLCHQDQFPRAIKLLLPRMKNEVIDENLLHFFIQIAIYDKYQVSEKVFVSLIERAKTEFPNSFCQLFSIEKMGIQQLKNQVIKEFYCTHCNQ